MMKTHQREDGDQQDEIDKAIELIAQRGDMASVVDELVASRRYDNLQGIKGRVQKYKNPLFYKYDFILRGKKDKLKFINKLRPSEKKEFFEHLRDGWGEEEQPQDDE